jgi:hypothetical protein
MNRDPRAMGGTTPSAVKHIEQKRVPLPYAHPGKSARGGVSLNASSAYQLSAYTSRKS